MPRHLLHYTEKTVLAGADYEIFHSNKVSFFKPGIYDYVIDLHLAEIFPKINQEKLLLFFYFLISSRNVPEDISRKLLDRFLFFSWPSVYNASINNCTHNSFVITKRLFSFLKLHSLITLIQFYYRNRNQLRYYVMNSSKMNVT